MSRPLLATASIASTTASKRGLSSRSALASREELDTRPDFAGGVNGSDALGQDLGFETPDRGVQRRELAVHVAQADLVEVDQGQGPNSGTASASTAHDPTPPRPTTATCAARERSRPAWP